MQQDCLFCKIVDGSIPCTKVYEDEDVLAFADITPQAPTHVLLVPKAHYDNAYQAAEHNPQALCALFAAVNKVVNRLELLENGYRVVINTGRDGNQTVNHLHLHLLAGRLLLWPPG